MAHLRAVPAGGRRRDRALQDYPAHLLPGQQKAYAGKDGPPFNAAESYREAESAAESDEADFRQKLAAFETDFPALATPALRRRLLDAPLAECTEWLDELAAELAALHAQK